MKKLTVRRPVLVLTLLVLLLWRDHSGLVRMALAASLLHESGHILVYCRLTGRFPPLTLSAGGIGLRLTDERFTPRQLLALAAAGPAVNLTLCAVFWLAQQRQASYAGSFFAGVNLCLGLFNLLPVGPLDGRRMLAALAAGRQKRAAEHKKLHKR